MKIIYEARVSTVLQHEDNKDGSPKYSSGVEWKEGSYNTRTIYVGQRLELGQKMWVVVTDFDPDVIDISAEPSEAETDAQPLDPICQNCDRPASEHSNGADDFSHCPNPV